MGRLPETLVIPLAPGRTVVELVVSLSAPGFALEGLRDRHLVVCQPFKADSERVVFRLTALDPGDGPATRVVRADFWMENTCIGSVSRSVTVLPPGYLGVLPRTGPKVVDRVRVPRVMREPCDLIIGVRHEPARGSGVYAVSLRSVVPGRSYEWKEVGSIQLNGQDVGSYISELLDPEFNSYPKDPTLTDEQFEEATALWNRQFGERLKEVGRQLWLQLPEGFRSEYFELQMMDQPPSSIAVYSDDLIFPWELLVPWSEREELPPLGVGHLLGRWKPGLGLRPDPQKFLVQNFVVLSPRYSSHSLSWTEEEIADLKQIVPRLIVVQPCDKRLVNQVLHRSDVQFMHFSGHGLWSGGTADLTALLLEDGSSLAAVSFLGKPIGRCHPILYLNACTVGRAGIVLGCSGGFAANCLASGWTGIIAPYWPVNDASAKDFAIDFYRRLAAARSVGEALQELRRDHPADPTYQAYAYIGDPLARVILPSA